MLELFLKSKCRNQFLFRNWFSDLFFLEICTIHTHIPQQVSTNLHTSTVALLFDLWLWMDCLEEDWTCFRFEDAFAGFPNGASGDVLANGLCVLHPCWNMVVVEMGFVRCLGSYVNMYAMVDFFQTLTSCRRWWSIWCYFGKKHQNDDPRPAVSCCSLADPEENATRNDAGGADVAYPGFFSKFWEPRYVSHCHADASSITSIFRYLGGLSGVFFWLDQASNDLWSQLVGCGWKGLILKVVQEIPNGMARGSKMLIRGGQPHKRRRCEMRVFPWMLGIPEKKL